MLVAAVARSAGTASVLWIHGPGGIGKSSLLRQVAAEARRQERPVVEVDGRFVGQSTSAFEEAAAPAHDEPDAVLLVDTFEQCQWIETWLRDRYLPRLPGDVVVVLAGREPPDLEWRTDPGWAGAVRTLALEPLSRDDAEELLVAGGLATAAHDAVIRFAGGNPLTLSLAVAVAASPRRADATWAPSAEVLHTLLSRLVGDVPAPEHRRALEVAALASTTTVDLLRVALPEQDAPALFAWLREQPYIESLPAGLHPHDAVRESLAADLRWRDQQAFDAVRTRLSDHLLSHVRRSEEHDAAEAMGALLYLYRDLLGDAFGWEGRGDIEDGPMVDDDRAFVLRTVQGHEGVQSADLAAHWMARQPEAFVVYRSVNTSAPVAFSARLTFTAPPEPDDLAEDPVLRAAWEHCLAVGLADGDRFAVARFAVHSDHGEGPSTALSLAYWLALARVARDSEIAHGFLVYRDAASWSERLDGAMPDTGVRTAVGDREYALFGRDWRGYRFEDWLLEVIGGVPPQQTGPAVSRPDLEDAVRQALQLWRTPGALGSSRLAQAVAGRTGEDADRAVRALVRSVLDGMREDQRGLHAHDAVVATFMSGAVTQKAAARRLSMPFSTYRRHLAHGIDQLTGGVWQAVGRPRTGTPAVGTTEQC